MKLLISHAACISFGCLIAYVYVSQHTLHSKNTITAVDVRPEPQSFTPYQNHKNTAASLQEPNFSLVENVINDTDTPAMVSTQAVLDRVEVDVTGDVLFDLERDLSSLDEALEFSENQLYVLSEYGEFISMLDTKDDSKNHVLALLEEIEIHGPESEQSEHLESSLQALLGSETYAALGKYREDAPARHALQEFQNHLGHHSPVNAAQAVLLKQNFQKLHDLEVFAVEDISANPDAEANAKLDNYYSAMNDMFTEVSPSLSPTQRSFLKSHLQLKFYRMEEVAIALEIHAAVEQAAMKPEWHE